MAACACPESSVGLGTFVLERFQTSLQPRWTSLLLRWRSPVKRRDQQNLSCRWMVKTYCLSCLGKVTRVLTRFISFLMDRMFKPLVQGVGRFMSRGGTSLDTPRHPDSRKTLCCRR